MYLAREVAARLRLELDDRRLGVKLDPNLGRWIVFVRRPHFTGARRWPVKLHDDGTVTAGGPTTFRTVDHLDDIVWVVEDDGQYHSLDPNLIRQALEKRDAHRRDVAKELFAEIRRRKEAKRRAQQDDLFARTRYYRPAFARLADQMGIGGRPDYRRIFSPKVGVVGA